MMTDTSALPEVSMDAVVSYSDNGLSVGGTTYDNTLWYYHWPTWYPSGTYFATVNVGPQPSKFEQAFKVVSKLLETGVIKSLTLKQFITTVGEVAAIL